MDALMQHYSYEEIYPKNQIIRFIAFIYFYFQVVHAKQTSSLPLHPVPTLTSGNWKWSTVERGQWHDGNQE